MLEIKNIIDEMELNVYKCKTVKTPSKSWEAAGWDFYVPENLTIFDFAGSYKAYLDESIPYDKTMKYTIPLVFYLKSNRTTGEYKCQLVLTWNNNVKQWVFSIKEYSNDILVSLDDPSEQIIQWLTEDETVISKIEVLPHAKLNIPSGIHVNLPDNVFLKVENKSGISSKRGLTILACVTGESLIETNKGKFTAQTLTKEFCDKNEILIKTFNEVTKQFEFRKCDGFRCTGEKDCINVKFDDGTSIEGSYDHCIYENEKWDSLENIN